MAEINLDSELEEIYCPKCGKIAKQVILAEKNIRRGWYCDHCEHFEKAIFRERTLEGNENG